MNYAIKILKEKADKHKEQLEILKSKLIHDDFELMADYYFIKNDIENQRQLILGLTNAINTLIK